MAKTINFNLFKRKIIIKMSNRNFYSLILLGVLILLGGGFLIVNALTPGVAPNPGHLISEVAPPAGCGSGQVLQFIDETNGWGCVDMASGGTNTDNQTLSVSGQSLSISSGNSVALPASCVITSINAMAKSGDTYQIGYWSGTSCTNCPFGTTNKDNFWRYYCKHYNGAQGPMCEQDKTQGTEYFDWEINYPAIFTCS